MLTRWSDCAICCGVISLIVPLLGKLSRGLCLWKTARSEDNCRAGTCWGLLMIPRCWFRKPIFLGSRIEEGSMPGVSQRRATRKWGKLAGSEGSRGKSGHTSFSPSAWTPAATFELRFVWPGSPSRTGLVRDSWALGQKAIHPGSVNRLSRGSSRLGVRGRQQWGDSARYVDSLTSSTGG